MSRGLTLDELIATFINSDEFRQRIVPMLPGELTNSIHRQSMAEEVVAVDLGGYVVCVRRSDQDFGQAIIATRDYEPHVRGFLWEFVRAGQVVVDVRANVGRISFLAARLVGAGGRVIAIEPNPENVQLLHAGIVMNACTNVQVLPYAALDTRGIMSLKAIVTFAGFCSLVYQVVWERSVKYNFGGDSISSAIVTATFLLGLGIGAVLFGRWHPRPFALFALVEVLLGLYAIASYHVLAPLATILGRLFQSSIAGVEGLRGPVVVACVVFLLPPCILMGGTLPLMFNCFIRPERYRNSAVGLLYGLNALGAALGVLAAPFVLLSRRSIPSTLALVGVGNLLLGVAIWLYGRRIAPLEDAPRAEPAATDDGDAALPLVLTLGFLSGFISLAFEVSLFRAFSIFNPSSPYNFPGVLLPFLVSIAVGSIVLTRFREYTPARSLRRIGLLFILAVVSMLLGVVGSVLLSRSEFRWVFRQTPFGPENHLHGLLVYGLVMIVPFVFLLSGVFPLLLRLAARTGRSLPARAGLVSLVNALGAFAGAMLVQFVGFPLIGTRGVIAALFSMGVLAGAFSLWRAAPSRRQVALCGALLPLVLLMPFLVPTAVWDTYTFGRTGPNVERVEGTTGVASIEWGRFRGRVFVNGQGMSALPDHRIHVQLDAAFVQGKLSTVSRNQRGRPLKFGRPAQLLALTLPQDVVAALRRIHPDPAWAIVSLCERLAKTDSHPPPASRPVVELAQLSAHSALIVVDPRVLRSVPGMSVVPVASGRAFLAFDEGRGLADLELAVFERVHDPSINAAMRKELRALHRQVRDWRQERGFRFSKRSIILVERVSSPRRRRGPRARSS